MRTSAAFATIVADTRQHPSARHFSRHPQPAGLNPVLQMMAKTCEDPLTDATRPSAEHDTQPADIGRRARHVIIGIDLGPTNSLVAYTPGPNDPNFADTSPRVLTPPDEDPIIPSAVQFRPDGSVVVGSAALESASEYPAATITSVKRLMGRSITDAQDDLPTLGYEIIEGEHDTARIRLPRDQGRENEHQRIVSPPEVSAHILAALKQRAERVLGNDVVVRKAVITVPAYFDDTQRQATRDAARLAGLDAVRIVNEPTAAALAYGLASAATAHATRNTPRTIAVYDFGGGTFDISILRITPGDTPDDADAFQVLATSGDTRLGGDDIDQTLMAHLWPGETSADNATNTANDYAQRRRRRTIAERLKIELSTAETATIEDNGSAVTLSRADFESLIAPLVERTLDACRRALRDVKREHPASLDTTQPGSGVSAVVMVGGSTRIPLVRQKVGELFGVEPYTALNPEQVVALGASVQAAVLAGDRRDALLLDVVPLSLGIETVGGAVAKLVMRNSTVPLRATERFSTSIDNQTSIKLHVLQGEREMAEDCRSLGVFHLAGIPPMPAGIPKLVVTFAIDASGVLNVSAVEERSGKRAAVQIVPAHGLTRQEVERIEQEAFAHARDDMARHRIVDLVANASLDLHWIRRQIDRVRNNLEPAYLAQLESAIAGLDALNTQARADWRSVDANAFHAAKQKLDELSVRLHEVSIAQSLRDELGDKPQS